MQEGDSNGFCFIPADRVSSCGATVWQEFPQLALRYETVDLGQGAPNWAPPDHLLQAATSALNQGKQSGVTVDQLPPSGKADLLNAYAPPGGHKRLVNALIKTYGPLLGQDLKPHNILPTVGCSEALYCAWNGLLNKGDEVILIEPYFDLYAGGIKLAGGVLRYCSLKPHFEDNDQQDSKVVNSSQLRLDMAELEALFNEKTRILVLNTPNNPTGKIFSRKELEDIAGVVSKHPHCVVVCDEVYEFITFDGVEHVRFASLPGMWERTLTLTSAAKTFSVTGWKVGWAIGPQPLISACLRVHQFGAFCVATPLQEAVAIAFERADELKYFEFLRNMYQKKRDILVEMLKDIGLSPIVPQGAFYICADIGDIDIDGKKGTDVTVTGQNLHLKDWNFCRWLITQIGVTAIPCSAFYENPEKQNNLIRFCFCKTDDVFEKAKEKLLTMKQK